MGEPILTVENSYELIFFLFPNKNMQRPRVDRDSRVSRFVPGQFPDRFVFQYGDEKRSRMAGLEWKRRQVFHFQNRKVFLLSQGI